jgi:hypothetical protein
MEDKHGEQWLSICRVKGLKLPSGNGIERTDKQPFAMEQFMHYLTQWVAADDRVCDFLVSG